MARASFAYHLGYPVVDVSFVLPDGVTAAQRRLLVDSGFTGRSALIIDRSDEIAFERRPALEGHVRGALSGRQLRAWLACSVPDASFHRLLLTICTDLAPLGLPAGVSGMVGLTFLQYFCRWGAEHNPNEWQFFLET